MANIPTNGTVAAFIDERLREISKTDRQVAQDAGLGSAHALKLMAKGDIKVPLDRIEPLAKALDVDPADLFRLVMQEYMPEAWSSIENMPSGAIDAPDELAQVRAPEQASNFAGHGAQSETEAPNSQPISLEDGHSQPHINLPTKGISSCDDLAHNRHGESLHLRCAVKFPGIGWGSFSAEKLLSACAEEKVRREAPGTKFRVALALVRSMRNVDTTIEQLEVATWQFCEDGNIAVSEVMKDAHDVLKNLRSSNFPERVDVNPGKAEVCAIANCLGVNLSANEA